MHIRPLLAALALNAGEPPKPEPDAGWLVERLASDRWAERSEAAIRLVERGRDALPALRDALGGDDPRLRVAAWALIGRINGDALGEPTRVDLDFDGLRLAEAASLLADRTGMAIVIDEGDDPGLADRAIVADAPSPLPFWEALARLSEAVGVRPHPGHPGHREDARPTIHLVEATSGGPSLVRGPFRVDLPRLSSVSVAEVLRIAEEETGPFRTLTVEVQVFAEPRLFLELDGPPVFEAADPEGRRLPPPPSTTEWPLPSPTGWIAPGAVPMQEYPMHFGVPEPPPDRIAAIRGTFAVIASQRRAGPIDLPLDGNAEEVALEGGGRLRIDKFTPGRSSMIALVITPEAETDVGGILGSNATGGFVPGPSELIRNRIEVIGDDDAPMVWRLSRQSKPGESEPRLVIHTSTSAPAPIRLRYYQLDAARLEVPFEFRDVPWP